MHSTAKSLEKNPGATAWIATVRTLLDKERKPKDLDRKPKDWWCAPKSASPGDLLIMYQSGIGIVRVERIESQPREGGAECSKRHLLTVDTTLVLTLTRPITIYKFRAHSTLCNLPAVRRNFQGTCLRVPEQFWPDLKRFIEAHC